MALVKHYLDEHVQHHVQSWGEEYIKGKANGLLNNHLKLKDAEATRTEKRKAYLKTVITTLEPGVKTDGVKGQMKVQLVVQVQNLDCAKLLESSTVLGSFKREVAAAVSQVSGEGDAETTSVSKS